jgi:xanthine permease
MLNFQDYRNLIRSISILLGLLFGTIVAAFMGKVSLQAVGEADWFPNANAKFSRLPKSLLPTPPAISLIAAGTSVTPITVSLQFMEQLLLLGYSLLFLRNYLENL